METNIVNSCRVCRCSNDDGDFVRLLEENSHLLTGSGRLYEDLMELTIVDTSTVNIYPLYLCKSCDLQMKLFKKLRTKAKQTMKALDAQFMSLKKCHRQLSEENLIETLDERVGQLRDDDASEKEVLLQDDSQEYFMIHYEGVLEDQDVQNSRSCDEESYETVEYGIMYNNGNDSVDLEGDLHDVVDKPNADMLSSVDYEEFIDVHYLDDVMDGDASDLLHTHGTQTKARSTHCCYMCNMQFPKKADLMEHRKAQHRIKHRCNECNKSFHSADTLDGHMRTHRGLPAYQCELCNKTFNQKVHFNYHMDRHNNIRNFKCEVCGKTFITKGDLAIHTRTHTGDRRYSCDICNKEFLLLIHMKHHRYSHFEKEFGCAICHQKFVSPSTLRTHIQSIHAKERRFQCEMCVKKFRRKHHLIAHYKVHRKQPGECDDIVVVSSSTTTQKVTGPK